MPWHLPHRSSAGLHPWKPERFARLSERSHYGRNTGSTFAVVIAKSGALVSRMRWVGVLFYRPRQRRDHGSERLAADLTRGFPRMDVRYSSNACFGAPFRGSCNASVQQRPTMDANSSKICDLSDRRRIGTKPPQSCQFFYVPQLPGAERQAHTTTLGDSRP